MSTVALLGLLVVLLVAIGVAAFLLRGRRGARSRTDPASPPRTVGELVDRRRTGPDPAESTSGPERAAGADDRDDAVSSTAGTDRTATPERNADPGSENTPDTEPLREPDPGATAASTDTTSTSGDGAEISSPARGTIAAGSVTTGAVDAAGTAPGRSGAGSVTGPAGSSTTSEGAAPSPSPRPGSDVDTGPVSPPWSRGFVGGRQITPPASEASTSASTPPAAEEPGTAEDPARPSAPPRQQSRSPVDPDLVKRVTAVPSAAGPRTSDPDTEREFREARDRMAATTGVRTGRVPEQSSRSPESTQAPSPAPRPSPSPRAERGEGGAGGTAAAAGGVAATAVTASVLTSGSSGDDDGDDPDETRADRPAGTFAGSPAGTTADTTADTSTGPTAGTSAGDSAGTSTGTAGTSAGDSAGTSTGTAGTAAGGAADTSADATTNDSATTGPSAPHPSAPHPSPAPRPTPRVMRSVTPTGTDAEPAGDPTPAEPAVPVSSARGADGEDVVAFTGRSPARRAPVPGGVAQDVHVHVVDRDARPLAHVTLSMVDGAGAPAGTGTTGAGGDARLRVPGAGQYVVVASASGHETRTAPCAVADEPVRIAVTLPRSSALHGIARSASGDVRTGTPVALTQDGETLARTDTAGDGTFRFADLDAGHYRIVAGDGPEVTVLVPAEADVEHDVEVGGTGAAAGTRS